MKKGLIFLVSVLFIAAGASSALAGAYGEPEAATELPAPPPPAVVAAPAPEVAPAPAAADYARNGYYLIGAGTAAFENFDNAQGYADDTLGFNLRAGRRLCSNAAVELEYEWYDDFGYMDPSSSPGFPITTSGSSVGNTDAWSLMANTKLFALTGRVQPFALLGAGVLAVDAGSTDKATFAGRLGGGVDVYVTENFALTVDASYVMPTAGLSDLAFTALSWGGMYRF